MVDHARTRAALVVGAGPSGLVAAKYLLASTNPRYEVTVLESSDEIGGTFVNKVYDNTRLVSSKFITSFSDFRMEDDYPNHPSAAEYVAYLKRYCDRYSLWNSIKFGCHVISLSGASSKSTPKEDENADEKGYNVQYRRGAKGQAVNRHFDVVAVCSGLHNMPNRPSLPAISKFSGQVIHSSQYKCPSMFNRKRVLILGSGETAMDIALRSVQNPLCRSIALNVRRGFLSIPHNLAKDRPLDVFITNLFEHAYEHPWVQYLRLRWILSTVVIRFFLFCSGSGDGFNQWACKTTPIRRGYHIINKSHGAMAHLNIPIKSETLWGRFWMKLYGEAGLRPIESFHRTSVSGVKDNGKTVQFDDGREYDADLIVLATGYKQYFPFLDESIKEEYGHASDRTSNGEYTLDEDGLPSEHFIVSQARPRLAFIGFVRPNVGAIPPISELQVMWWLCRLNGQIIKPLELPSGVTRSYMLLGAKYPYGVDFGNYMHRVAEDIGAAPALSTLAGSEAPFRALYTYCLGQSMIPLFCLQGPFASKVCWQVVTDELWQVCMKRGWAENFGLVAVLWISLWMNLAACLLEIIWCLCVLRRPRLFSRYY